MKKSRRLVLVRHGESLWNKKGLWTGWTDIPLSTRGKKEAKLAGNVLSDIDFDFAYTSDLKRASQTLEIILSEINSKNISKIVHHAYKERHYGIFTGKNKWELQKIFGKEKFQKIRRGWDEPIPEGETLKDVYNRVVPHFKENVLPQVLKGKNVLIVAHGNTHRAIIKYLENISHEKIVEVEMDTGEAIVYEFNEKGEIISKEKRLINKQIKIERRMP